MLSVRIMGAKLRLFLRYLSYMVARNTSAMPWQRFDYTPDAFWEQEGADSVLHVPAELGATSPSVFWLNVHGHHQPQDIELTCKELGLPVQAAVDLLDTNQRPTLEEYPGGLYFSLKSIEKHRGTRVELEQIAFVLVSNGVWSVQEKPADLFGGVRDRLRTGKGMLRMRSADYLLYTLLDAVLVPYREVLSRWEETVDRLEDDVLERPHRRILVVAQTLKRDLVQLRRALLPLREAVSALEKGQFDVLREENRPYFRDLREKTLDLLEGMEALRAVLDSVEALYISALSQKTNEVMRVLTVFSTIFMPLTFIVGVYGMNFEYMPELRWTWGYAGAWGLMLAVGIGMYFWIKRRGWW